MSGPSTYEPQYAATRWIDQRLPIIRMGADFMTYPSPRNLNYWYTFGAILSLVLVSQILTGVILGMHYTASIDLAFDSVQRIRRDVPYGWLLQSMHAVGASMFFLAVYMHMFRGLYYGSYKAPRELLWIIGVLIYLVMMATAFLGYTLPWGQMSFWGATVITGFFGAIPMVGTGLQEWLLGGYAVSNATLTRFYSLHYVLPFVIAGLVGLHVWGLHHAGQNNPIGVTPKTKSDTLAFHPFYTVKDGFAVVIFLIIFAFFIFYQPDALGHADNYIPADPLKTPAHIVPEWYFLPFYAILRAVPDKLAGILLMFGAIAVLFVLPWLDTSKVRSMRFRPVAKWFFFLFIIMSFILGWCGAENPDDMVFTMGTNADGEAVGLSFVVLTRIATAYYFAYFLIILPVVGLIERPIDRPASITESVLGAKAARAKAKAEKEPVVIGDEPRPEPKPKPSFGGGLQPAE